MIDERHRRNHWRATKSIVFLLSSIFLVITVVIPMIFNQLGGFSIFGFPMGYFLFAIGGLIVMVWLTFWMAIKQDKIDRKYGASENI